MRPRRRFFGLCRPPSGLYHQASRVRVWEKWELGMQRESPAKIEAPRKRQALVVDDHSSVRMALRMVINGEPDMAVCGEVEDAGPALAAVEQRCPDILIVDIALKASH